jgi:hypothetical protein
MKKEATPKMQGGKKKTSDKKGNKKTQGAKKKTFNEKRKTLKF